jgi:hypothetical protein
MGVIKGHFDRICIDAITKYSKKNKITEPDTVQVLLYLADGVEAEPGFMMLRNYQGQERITAKQLLGVKVDFRGRAGFLEDRTGHMLQELVEEHKMQWQQIRVIVELKENQVVANLYQDNDFIQVLDMEAILSDEKMLQENG